MSFRPIRSTESRAFTSQPRELLVAGDEQTGLLLYDRGGHLRAKLVVTDDEPKLLLREMTSFDDPEGSILVEALPY